jgi:HEAT repeat protein
MGDDGVSILLRATRDTDPVVALSAVISLEEESLRKVAMKSQDQELRALAIVTYGQHYGSKGILHLERILLTDPSLDAKIAVGIAMEKIGEKAVPFLSRALQDKDPSVRMVAAHSLTSMGPVAVSAMPALEARLEETVDPDERRALQAAIEALTPEQ